MPRREALGFMRRREGLGFQLPPGPRVVHLLKQEAEAPRHRDAELGVGRDRDRQHPESISIDLCLLPDLSGANGVSALLIT